MSTPSKAYLIESAHYGDPSPRLEPLTHKAASPDVSAPPPAEAPADYIPGIYTLGSTYDVLNGIYAEGKSTKQQVIDWSKSGYHVQKFGGREYSVPDLANFTFHTNSDYRASFGKTTSEYSKSLSVHAGFEASFPGFSASASTDYNDSERENLSHAFTRISYNVTHYDLSLPPVEEVKGLLKEWFIHDLDKMNPIELYKEYGTHLLRSLTVGGRALFLYATDTRSYESDMSLETAANISASYGILGGKMELSVKQREAMQDFNESSHRSIVTKGGDPQYGNEGFLESVKEWAASILDYPEFVDFGSFPAFVGLWELASTPQRRETLQKAYADFVRDHRTDLLLPGPYIHARITTVRDPAKTTLLPNLSGYFVFPPTRSDGWSFIGPSAFRRINGVYPNIVIVKELVPGALAPVKWVEFATLPWSIGGPDVVRIWTAQPPTPDYVALGSVAMRATTDEIPSYPPESLVGQFRAVHKAVLTRPVEGVTDVWESTQKGEPKVYEIDYRYLVPGFETPPKDDLYVLDPKMCIKDWEGW